MPTPQHQEMYVKMVQGALIESRCADGSSRNACDVNGWAWTNGV